MKEEIIKKLYEEYQIKCLNEMFEGKMPTWEEFETLGTKINYYDTYDFSDRIMTDDTAEKIAKKLKSDDWYFNFSGENGFYVYHYYSYPLLEKNIIYNFLGKKLYASSSRIDCVITRNGYCIIKEKSFTRDGKSLCRLIDINGLTLLKAERIKYIGNGVYAKKNGDRVSFVNIEDEELFFYREGISSVNEIIDINSVKFTKSRIIKYCDHYYYHINYLNEVLYDSSLRLLNNDENVNFAYYLIKNERRECNIDSKNIQIKINGYKLLNKGIKLKYKPIYEYQNHIICDDKVNYYLYNIKENKYYKLGFRDDIVFYAGLIIDKLKHTAYFLDSENNDYRDVTSIFENKLKGAYKINYTKLDMLSYFEFKNLIENDSEYQQLIDKKIEELLKQKEELIKKQTMENATKILEKREEEKNGFDEELKKELKSLKEIVKNIERLQMLSKNTQNINNKDKILITEDMLLRTIDSHKVIDKNFKNILNSFNLIVINFNNVDVSDTDFSYTNANINPQVVYNKNMSNSKFCGLSFPIGISFAGVDIKGSDFSECSEFINFDGAICDDATIFPTCNKKLFNIKKN